MPYRKYQPIFDIIKDCKKVACFGEKREPDSFSAFILMQDGTYFSHSVTVDELNQHRQKRNGKISKHESESYEILSKAYVLKALYKMPGVQTYLQQPGQLPDDDFL